MITAFYEVTTYATCMITDKKVTGWVPRVALDRQFPARS
jgi:hypothetical protein